MTRPTSLMSWGGTAFVFGRYSGRTFADVAEKERGYCVWVMREYLKFGSKSYRPCSPQLIEFAEWLLYYRFEILPENERPTDRRVRGRRSDAGEVPFFWCRLCPHEVLRL